MRLEFKPQAFDDLQYWVQHQPKLAKRLLRLIEETQRDPFGGVCFGDLSPSSAKFRLPSRPKMCKFRLNGRPN